jgi:hypothetical protein
MIEAKSLPALLAETLTDELLHAAYIAFVDRSNDYGRDADVYATKDAATVAFRDALTAALLPLLTQREAAIREELRDIDLQRTQLDLECQLQKRAHATTALNLSRLRAELDAIGKALDGNPREGLLLIDRVTALVVQRNYDEERCNVWQQEVETSRLEINRLRAVLEGLKTKVAADRDWAAGQFDEFAEKDDDVNKNIMAAIVNECSIVLQHLASLEMPAKETT